MNKLPRVKVGNVDKSTLTKARAHTIAKMQAYIKKHPGCSAMDMVFNTPTPITTMKFLELNTVCTQCGHIEEKASYVFAQRAMGHMVTFTCECGNRFNV